MKNLFVCSNLLFLLISCSTDSDTAVFDKNKISTTVLSDTIIPENQANPFDYKGKQYYDALSKFQELNKIPNSINDVTEQIKFITAQFENVNIGNANIIPVTDEVVESIMDDPENRMIKIVQNSKLGSAAKISLIAFLQDLISKRELEFTVTYDFIVNYEDIVISNSTWSQGDREAVLTVTSISRHLLYSEFDRKDRDWEKSAGNKTVKPFFSHYETSIITIIALLETLI